MRLAKIETIPLSIPFEHGGPERGFLGADWSSLSILLLRVETDDGLVGWGEAFSYNCWRSVQAAVEDMIVPIAIGRDAANIAGLMHELQQKLHIFGRYGVTMFALSGLDIALWDLAAKRAGQPLHQMLGGAVRERLPAYASLFRYGDAETVAERCRHALDAGYRYIKLHEITAAEVRIARETIGDQIPLMVDTNCPWTPNQARLNALQFKPYNLYWLEEPVFPPEDFASLARLQREVGIPLASGENACTAFEFERMMRAGAVTYAQPSVTKVGGITELMRVADIARVHGTTLIPHSPYFGPGFLATLQAVAALPEVSLIERFYLKLEASLYGDLIDAVDGDFDVPNGPGLGCEPDPDVIRDYRRTVQ